MEMIHLLPTLSPNSSGTTTTRAKVNHWQPQKGSNWSETDWKPKHPNPVKSLIKVQPNSHNWSYNQHLMFLKNLILRSNTTQLAATAKKSSKLEGNKMQEDRKFVIVIDGINESSKGTPKNEILNHDLDKVTSIVTQVESSVSPLSIWDLLRLGKYCNQSKKPRQTKPYHWCNNFVDKSKITPQRNQNKTWYVTWKKANRVTLT